jgi:cysteine desulfurase
MTMKLPVYLDNNATTPIDPRVLEAMLPVLSTHFGNPSSTTHPYGWHAEELVQIAREEVAALINARPDEIVFTSGATEANNLAIKGFVKAALNNSETPRVVSVTTEHKSVLDPLKSLDKQGVAVALLQVAADGMLDLAAFQKALLPGALMTCVMLANNEIGVIQDIRALVSTARNAHSCFFCDATQAVGKIPVDVNDLGVDLLSLSAHKIYGPKGAGALYIRKKSPRLCLAPLLEGGGHEQGYRSGTLNVAGIVGFGRACRIAQAELEQDAAHLSRLGAIFLEELTGRLPGVEINGSRKTRIPGNLNLALEQVNNARLVAMVNTKVAFSLSSACQSASSAPSHVLQALGINSEHAQESIRIGIGRFNTEEEILFAARTIVEACGKIRLG